MQLWESTVMLGSAALSDPGSLRFEKVAGAGGAGGIYALCPPVCFAYQALLTQSAAAQLFRPSGKAMFALPSLSRVML